MKFGYENPALTGILSGQVWGGIYYFMSMISHYFNLEKAAIKVNVTPIFINPEPLEVDFIGIFQLRVGHIIITCFFIFWCWILSKIKLVSKKGSDMLWTNIRYKV